MNFLKWLGGIISAVVIYWLTVGALEEWKLGRHTAPPKEPTRPDAIQDETMAAVEAMEWLRSRCGEGVELVVPFGVGSTPDQAARVFISALTKAGVRPGALVLNMPGSFHEGGTFSAERFDAWRRQSRVPEGCLLVVVPHVDRQTFPAPRVKLALNERAYSVVLPRGELIEITRRWDALLANASSDADFIREIRSSSVPLAVSLERV